MQDGKVHGRNSGHNDTLILDLALTRRQSRSLYRNWVIHSKKQTGYSFQSQSEVLTRISSCNVGNDICFRESSSSLIEDRADEIVRHMEQSQTFMDDNPKSNIERIETLRVMTEYLTLKRSVKKKLSKSINPKSKTLNFWKRLRYSISIFFSKIPVAIKNFLNNFELWYSSLKVIEGHFGSSVASYFKFLRKLFLLNACIFILIFFFIMVPQLLFRFVQYMDDSEIFVKQNASIVENTFVSDGAKALASVMLKKNPYEENEELRLGNIFTGEGFLTNTILFYGYYTNTSLQLFEGYSFNIPASYFFTSAVSYVLIFFFLFTSVAVSYRKCYIETSGGISNTFSNKIFCGWDFGIATKQAAELKSKSIYIEIKELLDDLSKSKRKKSFARTFYTTAICFSLNGILLFLLGVGGMYSWKYLDQQMIQADTATTMMIWLILTLVIAIAPVVFSLITHLEGFESPSSALYMTLIRTFTLYAVVIAVVVAYRLNRSTESECWETILGQDMYRLVLLDFIFGLVGTALSEFIRYRIFVTMWEGIGCPEFDIARSTMNLIYNQTLFYVGLYFSPVLSFIITIKMFLTFYIKKWGAVYNCKPFLKPWRASQAHTVYLSIAFIAFFSVVIAYGYIITSVKTSNCGPFRGKKFMYESILEEISDNNNSTILTILYYITRPGVVGIALMALVLGVYYMRAVAFARIHVVNHLRHLLLLKAEDRKLLLNEISKYTKTNCSTDNGKPPSTREGFSDSDFANHSSNLARFNESCEISEHSLCKHADIEVLKQAKLAFSSLINLPVECKKYCRPSDLKFTSVQNVNESIEQEPATSTGFRNNLNQNKAYELVEMKNISGSQGPDGFSGTRPNVSRGECSQTFEEKNSLFGQNAEDEMVGPGNTKLNFNPIFTESRPFDGVEGSISDDSSTNTSLPKSKKRSQLHVNPLPVQGETSDGNNGNFKNYVRFQERVPSRISFDSDSDRRNLKKKKRI